MNKNLMNKKFLLIILIFLINLIFLQKSSAETDLIKLAAKIRPAVATVITYDINRNIISIGSGFFINKEGHFMTNFHVLRGGHDAEVKIFNGKIFPVTSVITKNETFDIIKVRVDIPQNMYNVVRITNKIPQVAEKIFVVGSPMGLEQSVSDGIVSAIRDLPNIQAKVYQITAAISPGSSGSPVVNMNGEAIGIATFQLLRGQNLNFAVPNIYLLGLENDIPKNTLKNEDGDIKIYKKKNGHIIINDK